MAYSGSMRQRSLIPRSVYWLVAVHIPLARRATRTRERIWAAHHVGNGARGQGEQGVRKCRNRGHQCDMQGRGTQLVQRPIAAVLWAPMQLPERC